MTDDTAARIDGIAAVIAMPHPDSKALRDTYDNDDRLRVPNVVISFAKDVPTEVTVGP